jgi:imidazolonepropionase-like amidohydrolase
MKRLLLISVFVALASVASAHDYIPGIAQTNPILLKGGDLHTVSDGLLEKTDLLFDNGRITQIGKNLTIDEGTVVIDVTGQHVYPGLIAPNTLIGLIEIGQVRATNDITEFGRVHPEVQTHIAYNPDSEIIPTVRSNGVTTALVVPGGSLIRGQSSLINLDGWTKEDATEKFNVAMHITWPGVSISSRSSKSVKEQKEQQAANLRTLDKVFDDARAYFLAAEADPTIKEDLRWEAMIPLLTGDMPLFVHANDFRQIEQAVHFARKQRVKLVIVGGREAWKLTDLLVENDVAVVYARTQALPMRQDDDYDLSHKVPKLLLDAGVRFCLSNSKSWSCRNLAFQAGYAAAFGMSREEALRAITLSPAEIFGVSGDLGSLEIGKKATLVVSRGDILDYLGHRILHMFIEGRQVDLDDKQKELYRKYQTK